MKIHNIAMSSSTHQCVKCKKLFTSKHGLTYHINNNVCAKISPLCPLCGKTFKSKQNRDYHISQRVCGNGKLGENEKPKLVLKQNTNGKYDNLSKEELIMKLTERDKKIMEDEIKYQTLKENPQFVSNNNIIVFPKEFGKEDMKYIQQKLGDIVGPLIKSHMFTSIPCLFDKIHNNQVMPEYHNVYTNGERSNYAMISDGKIFKHHPKKTVIDQIIESKRLILKTYVDTNGDQLGEKVLQKYERYQDLLDEDVEFRKNLELEIGGMLLDMKTVIANDENTRRLLEKVDGGRFEIDSES